MSQQCGFTSRPFLTKYLCEPPACDTSFCCDNNTYMRLIPDLGTGHHEPKEKSPSRAHTKGGVREVLMWIRIGSPKSGW